MLGVFGIYIYIYTGLKGKLQGNQVNLLRRQHVLMIRLYLHFYMGLELYMALLVHVQQFCRGLNCVAVQGINRVSGFRAPCTGVFINSGHPSTFVEC